MNDNVVEFLRIRIHVYNLETLLIWSKYKHHKCNGCGVGDDLFYVFPSHDISHAQARITSITFCNSCLDKAADSYWKSRKPNMYRVSDVKNSEDEIKAILTLKQ